MTNLATFTKKEISEKALSLGITLSYKDTDGKRRRFTKEQLIEKIEQVQITKIKNSNSYGKLGNVDKSESIEIELNLKSVVNDSIKLLKEHKVEAVKGFISKLINDINKEKRNKLLIRQMSMKVQILKSLLESYTFKVKEVTI